MEIIDYRTEVPRAIVGTIAGDAAFAAVVVGESTLRPMDVDIRWVGSTSLEEWHHRRLRCLGGQHGHPAAGIAWLVSKLHAVGAKLESGQIMLAGSFTRAWDIPAGDVIHADYGPRGAVGVSFV